jgi:hypothetical protein
MMLAVRFLPEAATELDDAVNFYNTRKDGLGIDGFRCRSAGRVGPHHTVSKSLATARVGASGVIDFIDFLTVWSTLSCPPSLSLLR